MQHPNRSAPLALVGALMLAASAVAAQPAPKIDGSAKLKAQAKVTAEQAMATALAQVPNGKVTSAEIEREKGKLLYSFDIATAGKSGIDEVQVDAITGKLIGGVEHESPAAEQKEAAKEAKEHAAKPAGTAKPKP
jgi:uncharacterized iron-regulated membrane protein